MDLTLEFIVGNDPQQLKANSTRRIKSHLSRQGWKSHRKAHPRPRHQRRRQDPSPIVFECVRLDEQSDEIGPLQLDLSKQLSLDWQLGGGRVDPFRACPGEWKPCIPALVDHYLMHMAVDIPELDQPGNKGLLRSRWFPLVISDMSSFQTILLLSASNAAAVTGTPYKGCDILQLKSDAITSINDAFSHDEKRVSDAVIGAVAKMASFEAMHGGHESYRVHMEGLHQMVMIRGGLDTLGLGGLLRRIIVWIDLNSSFLLKVPRYFPLDSFDGTDEMLEPNPERFVAP